MRDVPPGRGALPRQEVLVTYRPRNARTLTPLTTSWEMTPPGACNLLTGGPPLSGSERGAGALLADPRVAVCSFTGSSRGGEAVLNAAAPFARPSALELGGKGALIVLDDADVEAAADQALVGILSCARRRPVLFTVLFTRESCIPWFFTVGERHRCAVYAMPSTRRRRANTRGVE